jgi:hypothetical protein
MLDRSCDTLEEKLGAIKGESGNVEVQWKNIKKVFRHYK